MWLGWAAACGCTVGAGCGVAPFVLGAGVLVASGAVVVTEVPGFARGDRLVTATAGHTLTLTDALVPETSQLTVLRVVAGIACDHRLTCSRSLLALGGVVRWGRGDVARACECQWV